MRPTLILSLLSLALACGGTRERPGGGGGGGTTFGQDCDRCIDIKDWEEGCGAAECTPGEDEACWDAVATCTSSQAQASSDCWRTCRREPGEWPDAPYPDTADYVLCSAGCYDAFYRCQASPQSFETCNMAFGECDSICE